MTGEDARRLALALPGASESAHFGKADFRAFGRIFATLPEPGQCVARLAPEVQEIMMQAEPAIFSPAAGAWGRRGWTRIDLARCDEPTLTSALHAAWRGIAPKRQRQE